jgi:uncharacterized protein YceK
MKKILIALFACLALSGCATINTLQPGEGISFDVHGKSYEEVWQASIRAMTTNLTLVSSDKTHGIIKSEAPAGFATWGEVVGVFITPTTPLSSTFTVEVVSEKRAKMQLTGQDWEPSVAARIKAELGL